MIIDKDGGSHLHPERISALLIGIDSRSGLFSLHVLFELIEIEPDHSRVRIEQFTRVVGFAPTGLLPIKNVVHLPKTTLEPGRFSSQGSIACVLMHLERIV